MNLKNNNKLTTNRGYLSSGQVESVLLSVPISFYILLPNFFDATVKYKFSFRYYQNHILSNIFDYALLQKRVYFFFIS